MKEPTQESEPKNKDAVKYNLNTKVILLFTNQNEMIRLMAENNRILMEMLLYGEEDG